MPQIAPYGSWKSPITSELIVSGTVSLGAITLDGEEVYWIENRPLEGGRYVIVRHSSAGETRDITPEGLNARTRVHEYGGGAYIVANGVVFFTNFDDQRIYRQNVDARPEAITPAGAWRYADLHFDPPRNLVFAVREDHSGPGEAVNTIVRVRAGGDEQAGEIVVSGHTFYSNPRISPDGTRLTWLAWNHPNMPWDGTELWTGDLNADGALVSTERVAGGPAESIFQPEWSPTGELYFVSDRSGWWNLYRRRGDRVEALHPMEAEFGKAQWVFGMSTYAFESATRLVCVYEQNGRSHLAALDLSTLSFEEIETPYTVIGNVHARAGQAFFYAGSPLEQPTIVQYDLTTRRAQVLRRAAEYRIDPGYLSIPEEVEFPTEGGKTAFGLFYPPHHRDYVGPPGEKPPLLVMSHGGPTAAASTDLDPGIQYWTSKGIAVLDVNYGGSTGYGRAYRERLYGRWGVVDVDDCVNGALYLSERGTVDRNRLLITGGSAGGYTTLCALTFRNVFSAGASHFGIGDLETFTGDTHKFESRYLDTLVGPYPERRDLYIQRSPIHFLEQLEAPVILFQGLEDKIVPPTQSEQMFAAVRAKGLPVAYLAFPGEQHGFRRAENIRCSLDGELYFYSRVLNFELADPVDPVPIENLPTAGR